MGGAAFPSAVKLNLGSQYKIETLLVNGAECEPYVTCDDRVMREYADEVIDGARIMAHVMGAANIIVGIEDNKPQAIEAMTKAAAALCRDRGRGRAGPVPHGLAHELILATTGRETPARQAHRRGRRRGATTSAPPAPSTTPCAWAAR